MTIRPVKASDIEDLYLMRTENGVFENTLGYPSERITSTEEFVKNLPKHHHHFVAQVDGRVVGSLGIMVNLHPRRKHSASFGMSVREAYQGQGVGSALMEKMCDLCDNWIQIHRIELGVYEDNIKAVNLYKKFGFVKEGVKVDAAFRNGKYVNEIIMARIRGGVTNE